MKFLIDTNVFIPLEPTSEQELTDLTSDAAELTQKILTAGHQLYLHPDQKLDIRRDRDSRRREAREVLFTKYPILPAIPPIPEEISEQLGSPDKGSNEWVDNQLIIALYLDAVDHLVTEDKKLRNKASRLGLRTRVLTLADALGSVRALFDTAPSPPPAVNCVTAYELDGNDNFFDSFREDYGPEDFDAWFRKCKLEHRLAWAIEGRSSRYAGVAIVNHEKKEDLGLSGKVLKICSFKISPDASGFHFGELLLKAIFHYAVINSYLWLYVTAFPKQDVLLGLLEDYGFEDLSDNTGLGEIRLVKPLTYSTSNLASLDAPEFHRKFGPYSFKLDDVQLFVVPIRPEFHRLLFPDAELELFPGIHPFGNSIRKAYLSHAATRLVGPGDVLLFYLSGDVRAITTVGVVEDAIVSGDANVIARYVSRRTVYAYREIQELCDSDVLAMLFRHAGILNSPIQFDMLRQHGVLSAAPQSTQAVRPRSKEWLLKELRERLPFYQSALDSPT